VIVPVKAAVHEPSEPRAPHWRVALILGVGNGIAGVLVLPYALAMIGDAKRHTMGLPIGVAYGIAGLQSAIFGFIVAWAGLRMGATIGLDAPLVRAWASRRPFVGETRWRIAAVIGVVAGGAILGLDALCFPNVSASVVAGAGHPTRWQGALASFYGAIGEEIQVRLFVMTLIAWCLAKATRRKAPWVFVTAIIVSALAFGAGHLPAAAQVFCALTSLVVVRTVVLNAIGGVAFGALYWRWGLEHAMAAHFCTDIVLHVVAGG
jgi:membrane protease YdiL (CAAX protease family)